MIATSRGRVVHSIPGRLRLRFDRGEAIDTGIEPLLARLRSRPGVRSARFSGTSGSVVVEYDPAAISQASVLGELPILESAALTVQESVAPSSPPARAVTSGWWEADALVSRWSGGRVDLRTLVPLALALLAIRELIRQGEMQAAPWHALLWYSYNIFYQFHPEMRWPPGRLPAQENA